MLYELPQSEYHRVRPLFDPHAHHIICMCGFNDPTTRIVVDSVDNPQSALMVTWEGWGYLAGDPDNAEFNLALNKAIWDRDVVSDNMWGLLLTAHPEGWLTQLPDIVAPSALVPFPRKHYTIDTMDFDWRCAVSDGYQIHMLNNSLLDLFPGIEIPDDAKKLLDVEDPLIQGFGFAAIFKGRIAAHAMIDFIYGNEGEIGLYTQEAHRMKGLAKVTSAAAIRAFARAEMRQVGLPRRERRLRPNC